MRQQVDTAAIPPVTAVPGSLRDEEAVGSNPATPTEAVLDLFLQVSVGSNSAHQVSTPRWRGLLRAGAVVHTNKFHHTGRGGLLLMPTTYDVAKRLEEP